MAAILDFQMSIYQPFEELQASYLEFKIYIIGTYFGTMDAILDFLQKAILKVIGMGLLN